MLQWTNLWSKLVFIIRELFYLAAPIGFGVSYRRRLKVTARLKIMTLVLFQSTFHELTTLHFYKGIKFYSPIYDEVEGYDGFAIPKIL